MSVPDEQFSRTRMIFGADGMAALYRARVAVFGVGGVGGYVVEALARSGVGQLDLIDNDTVSLSNLNRQIIATHSTVGMLKTDAAGQRIYDINPDCVVRKYPVFFTPETQETFDFSQYDYVVDAIDTVSGKIALVLCAQAAGIPIISSMGAGNKTEASALEVADIYDTTVCPLARVMRRELKKRGVRRLKVVYSRETAVSPLYASDDQQTDPVSGKRAPGSNAFVPAAAGLIIAGEVIKDLTGYPACRGEKKE